MDLKTSRLLSMALALVCLVASGLPAYADRGPWSDSRDGKGPLAIRKIEIGHRLDSTRLEVTFERPVDPARLDERDFIVFDFDGNGDRKSEEWVYFFPVRGRWRGVAYYPRTDQYELAYYDLDRTSRRSFRLVLPPYAHQSMGGYLFRVASSSRTGPACSKVCLDYVPNADWLIHDWTFPEIQRFEVPAFSLATDDTPAFQATWQVRDDGFSRLRRRTLWKRMPGAKEWERIAQDRLRRVTSRAFPTEQGSKLQLRTTATDGAGNTMSSEILGTVVPFDDANDANEAVYLGMWEEVPAVDAYLGSAHVSSTPLDTFRFTGIGRRFCISYRVGEEFGSGLFEVDDRAVRVHMDLPNYLGRTECVEHPEAALRTAVLSVGEGIINVDAYWFE
jgi:hypothetical protein